MIGCLTEATTCVVAKYLIKTFTNLVGGKFTISEVTILNHLHEVVAVTLRSISVFLYGLKSIV